jgi:osmotically inducible protein OsmC
MASRTAGAVWQGGLKDGNGKLNVTRAGFEAPYNFASRFEEGSGLSPEDLIAAAHAACFSMAFSGALEKAGFTPENIETVAEVTLEAIAGAQTISKIHLNTTARVPKIDEATFQRTAEDAKDNCPVSRLYKGAAISVTAKLK